MNPADLLLYYLPSMPMYVAWLVGGILALVWWHRHPRVSALMAVATVLFVLQSLVALAGYWLSWNHAALGWATSDLNVALAAISFGRSVVSAVAYATLLVAVYGWRKAVVPRGARYQPPEGEPPPREG
jgi:hypothetical protein